MRGKLSIPNRAKQRRYKHQRKPKPCFYDPLRLPLAVPYRDTSNLFLYRIDGIPGLWQIRNAMKNMRVTADFPVGRIITRKGTVMAAKFRQHHSLEHFLKQAMGWKILDPDKLIMCGECGEPAQWAVSHGGELVCDRCLVMKGAGGV